MDNTRKTPGSKDRALPANCQQPYLMLLTLPYVCGNDKMFVGMTRRRERPNGHWPTISPATIHSSDESCATANLSRYVVFFPNDQVRAMARAAAVSVGSMRYMGRHCLASATRF